MPVAQNYYAQNNTLIFYEDIAFDMKKFLLWNFKQGKFCILIYTSISHTEVKKYSLLSDHKTILLHFKILSTQQVHQIYILN